MYKVNYTVYSIYQNVWIKGSAWLNPKYVYKSLYDYVLGV